MPCACQLPPEVYPDATEWGPLFWQLLHGIAERVGTTPFPMYRADERRALPQIFKALAKTIPCPSCKDHYDSYLREHPVDAPLKDLPYEGLQEYVRRWFWELHNWVNESYGKPVYAYEDLAATYGRVDLRKTLRTLDIPMQKAIRVRGGQLFGYKEFTKWCITLFSIFGI
jgi:hypothetical protein